MEHSLSPELVSERDELTTEIAVAFDGVTREGGVSWSESRVIDAYGTHEERVAARAKDRDSGWRSLVEDESWNSDPGVGGWCFLDPVGFRYYLPAGMMRCIDSGIDEGLCFWLTLDDPYDPGWSLQKWSGLNEDQRRCVRRFIRYMALVAYENDWDWSYDEWQTALDSHWSIDEPKLVEP